MSNRVPVVLPITDMQPDIIYYTFNILLILLQAVRQRDAAKTFVVEESSFPEVRVCSYE